MTHSMDIDWDWTPNRKGHDLFEQEMCVCVTFDTNSTFYIDIIIIDGVSLERNDDLFTAIRRDLDNDQRFQDHVWKEKTEGNYWSRVDEGRQRAKDNWK